jgi:hypothetical protein
VRFFGDACDDAIAAVDRVASAAGYNLSSDSFVEVGAACYQVIPKSYSEINEFWVVNALTVMYDGVLERGHELLEELPIQFDNGDRVLQQLWSMSNDDATTSITVLLYFFPADSRSALYYIKEWVLLSE